jgi:O-acetyl-ADP-ribose deacetylase (regulator of RNase III)
MKEISGDLITLARQGKFDVIVHGCNCFCTMGAGIAKAIKKEFPEAFAADKQTRAGDRGKLGSYTHAVIGLGDKQLIVVNAYTQYDWQGNDVKVDYKAMRQVFSALRHSFNDRTIAYPLIGAGLAKGDWNQISQIIDEELKGIDHTLVRLSTVT